MLLFCECLLKLSSKFSINSPQFMYIFLSIIQLQEKPDISHKLASTIIQKINYNNFWTSFCEKHQRATALSLSISWANAHALSLLIFPTEISSICTFVLDLCYTRQYWYKYKVVMARDSFKVIMYNINW